MSTQTNADKALKLERIDLLNGYYWQRYTDKTDSGSIYSTSKLDGHPEQHHTWIPETLAVVLAAMCAAPVDESHEAVAESIKDLFMKHEVGQLMLDEAIEQSAALIARHCQQREAQAVQEAVAPYQRVLEQAEKALRGLKDLHADTDNSDFIQFMAAVDALDTITKLKGAK